MNYYGRSPDLKAISLYPSHTINEQWILDKVFFITVAGTVTEFHRIPYYSSLYG